MEIWNVFSEFHYAEKCDTCDHYDTVTTQCYKKAEWIRKQQPLNTNWFFISQTDPDGICKFYE